MRNCAFIHVAYACAIVHSCMSIIDLMYKYDVCVTVHLICMYMYVCKSVYLCMYVCKSVYACMYVSMYMYTYVYTYIMLKHLVLYFPDSVRIPFTYTSW